MSTPALMTPIVIRKSRGDAGADDAGRLLEGDDVVADLCRRARARRAARRSARARRRRWSAPARTSIPCDSGRASLIGVRSAVCGSRCRPLRCGRRRMRVAGHNVYAVTPRPKLKMPAAPRSRCRDVMRASSPQPARWSSADDRGHPAERPAFSGVHARCASSVGIRPPLARSGSQGSSTSTLSGMSPWRHHLVSMHDDILHHDE